MKFEYSDYEKSASHIKGIIDINPEIAIVLGSGLSFISELVVNKKIIPYTDIPNFPTPTVKSHKGELIIGTLMGKNVAIMNGRYHHYEGYSPEEVVYPIRVLKLIGAKKIILTNAAGGINEGFDLGDVMAITDQINFSGMSPLIGKNEERFGIRFFDMTTAYNRDLLAIARNVAKEASVTLREGVYAYMTGPQFETPAEIRALRSLGADAVGMSTVFECAAAHHMGMEVSGFSCITNMAAGVTGEALDDEEVNIVAQREKEKFSKIILGLVKKL